jgi:hypothetical protein
VKHPTGRNPSGPSDRYPYRWTSCLTDPLLTLLDEEAIRDLRTLYSRHLGGNDVDAPALVFKRARRAQALEALEATMISSGWETPQTMRPS